MIIRFRKPGVPAATDLAVGAMSVHGVTWVADPSVDPADASSAVADEVADWLGERLQLLSA
jgi:hypothetical protein